MLLIHRTIFKELLVSFLLSILFLNFTLMMEKLLRLSRIISGVGASLADIARIVLYLQPQLLILTLPMALLLSVLLVYGRMNADSELVILRGSGLSFRSISQPVLLLGLFCFAAGIAMSFSLSPASSTLLRKDLAEILTRRAPMAIEEGIFNTAFKGIVILIREKPSPDRLAGIFIVDDRNKEEQKVITAREGKLVPQGDTLSFSLDDGHVYITKESTFTEIQFGKYHFSLTPSIEPANRKNSEMTPGELWRISREVPDKRISTLLELHRRLSMPALCLVLVFLGPSLSLMAGKSGRLGGLTVGLTVFAVYYIFLLYGENLARSGRLPHFLGAWMSFAALTTVSLVVFERVGRR
ncbi:MAG: LptF/LptG family permease [Nitrospirales bacterium]|nr:LptF/LptG family permease [Nitrospirales bacterium]